MTEIKIARSGCKTHHSIFTPGEIIILGGEVVVIEDGEPVHIEDMVGIRELRIKPDCKYAEKIGG